MTRFVVPALLALAMSCCQGAPSVSPGAVPEAKLGAPEAVPKLRLAALFTDNMVLQRETEVPVWGRARPGENVTVELAGRREKTSAGVDGTWMVKLPGMKAGKAGEMTVSSSSGTVKIKNVAVGEVWLCSGQSNMARSVREAEGGTVAAAAADCPDVRMFRVQRIDSTQKNAVLGLWIPASRTSVPEFSAVAWFYGLRVYKSLGVPIGLIEASWGGTTAESWISESAAKSDPTLSSIMANVRALAEARNKAAKAPAARSPAVQRTAPGAVSAADSTRPSADTILTKSKPASTRSRPKPPAKQIDWGLYPSKAYDSMIAPLVPYAIRGVVWYQGETNAEDGRGAEYRTVLSGLIRSWRKDWGRGNIPFLVVQLPAYKRQFAEPSEGSWADVREAQLLVSEAMPNVHLTVALDLGSSNNIHPPKKQEVGSRLALAALEKVYGKNVIGSSPIFQSVRIGGPLAVITFKNVDGGLEARGGELKGFAMAGADRRFVWATATIEKDRVIVSSEKVPRPVAVRYGWADNPRCNLYNSAGLPASPFRTDTWPRSAAPADTVPAGGPRPAR